MSAHWYCVELDLDGNVQRCERVDAKPEHAGCGVVYVLADDEGSAKKKAYNLYQRIRLTERRVRYLAEGKCRCGRDRDLTGKRECSKCRERGRLHWARQTAKKKGAPAPALPPQQRKERLAERRDEARASIRLEVLQEVFAAWQDSATNGQFTAWLTKELGIVAGKAVA